MTRARIIATVAVVVTAFAAAAPVAAQTRLLGRPLAEVLTELRRAGLPIVFSSAVVTDDMRVMTEPVRQRPREVLDELLEPHGLAVRIGSGGSLVVVRTRPREPVTGAGPPTSTATVRGQVVDRRTGVPLPGVTVGLTAAPSRQLTDALGRFEIRDVAAGRVELFVSLVGYGLARPELDVIAGQLKEVIVPLADGTGAYSETVDVASDAYGRTDLSTPAQLSLTSAELQDLRGVLADDPLRAVQALPGVSTGDDYRSEFSVRGSDYRHMGIAVDGILGPWLVHGVRGREDTGTVSIVNGDVLGRVTLEPGAAPQVHPGRTGGWLALDLREGSRDRPGLRASVSGSSASMVAEGPIGDDSRGSWMVSARQSYLQWLFKQLDLEDTAAFGFTDVHSKLVYDFTGSHQLQFSLVAGRSKLEEENLDPGPNGLAVAHADSSLVTLAWRWTTGTAVIHQRMATLHDGFRNEGFFGQELGRGSGAALVYSADLVRPLTRHAAVRGGAYVERRRDGQTLRQFGRQLDGTAARALDVRSAGVDWMTSGFGGLTWTPVDPVSLDAGVRIAHASRIESTRASPWIVGAWSISSSLTVRAGVNGAHQFPDSDRISTSPTGELPGPERARHVDLGVEQRIGATWRWHVSAYARGERDVLRQQRAETRLVDGALIERDALPVWRNTLAVSARGLELVVQRRATSGLSGWIGYAYGRARAEDALTGETYWADFDQRHSLNAYGMVRMSTKTSVSTRLRLGSNFPVPGYFTREGLRLFLADRRNEVRLPVYARLDVRASRAFNYRTRRLTLFVELLNLLNRTNYGPADGTVRQSTREAAGYVEKLFPFVPSAGFTIEF